MTYVDRLAAIQDADGEIEAVEALANEMLEDDLCRTAENADAILRFIERNAECDGYGTFGTFNMVLEEVPQATLKPLLSASLERKATWVTEELKSTVFED